MSFETNYYKVFEKCTASCGKSLDLFSDDEISIAVMLQLLELGDERVSELSLPCQYVNAVFRVLDRAYMEDFEQVYCDNSVFSFVLTAIDGLQAMKENELSDVIKKSYIIYENNKEKIEQVNYDEGEFSDLWELELWTEVLEEFNTSYAKSGYLKPSVANYVRNNFQFFLNL